MLKKLKKGKLLLVLTTILGLLLRSYKARELFIYSHDQDLLGWFILDVVKNGHLRLIGQETSVGGVFIGPLWYYLQTPFYLFGGMNPLNGIYLSLILGVVSIVSIYYVVIKIFGKEVGYISTFIYAVNYMLVFTDREVVPTTPTMLWTIWFLYAQYLVYKGRFRTGFIYLAILAALVWHVNLALAIIFPLTLISYYFSSRKKFGLKIVLIATLVFLFFSMPFVFFEFRHGFIQIKSIALSLVPGGRHGEVIYTGFNKVVRVFELSIKNFVGVLSIPGYNGLSVKTVGIVGALCIYFAYINRRLKFITILFSAWILIYVIFFSLNSINLSEYYLNGLNIIWVILFSFSVSKFTKKKFYYLGFLVLFIYVSFNIQRILMTKGSRNGYIEKTDLMKYVKNDMQERGYNCVSFSYITDPGYNFGYRFPIWYMGIKTKEIGKEIPVYSIIFPLGKDGVRADRQFGAIGLVLPEYSKYTKEVVNKHCEGDDFNLKGSMFGYTQ